MNSTDSAASASSPRPAHASPKGSSDGKERKLGGETRSGFSFAAAAGKEGDVEGAAQG